MSYNSQTLFQDCIIVVEPFYAQLLSILDKFETSKKLSITNEDYMEAYLKIVECADSDQFSLPLLPPVIKSTEELLADWCFSKITIFIKQQLSQIEKETENNLYLEQTIQQWEKFTFYLFWMSKLFNYLDRFYLSNRKTTVAMKGHKLFREHLLDKISPKIVDILLEKENQEEPGQQEMSDKSQTLFEDCITVVEPVYAKLLSILDKLEASEKKGINNEDYMGAYFKIVECADSGQEANDFAIPLQKQIVKKNITSSKSPIVMKSTEELLADWCFNKITIFLKQQLSQIEKETENNLFLEQTIKQWEKFTLYLHWMSKLFNYLDRFYLSNTKTTVVMKGHKLFREHLFDTISYKLVELIFLLLEKERKDEQVQQEVITKIISYFYVMSYENQITLGKKSNGLHEFSGYFNQKQSDEKQQNLQDALYYSKNFENRLLQNIKTTFENKIQYSWATLSVPEYVQICLNSLAQEEKRCDDYYPNSKKLVTSQIEKILISDQAPLIAQNEVTGIANMLQKNKTKELSNIYLLFQRVPTTIEFIAISYQKYLQSKGEQLNSNENITKQPLEYIRSVFAMKDESDTLMNETFLSNLVVERQRDTAFKHFLNQFDKTPRFLSMYCDFEQKKNIRGNEDSEIEAKFSKIISILRYIYSRDAFLTDYTKYLSVRLLNGQSLSDEAEQLLVSKLKVECGQTNVSKIIKMKEDISESKTEESIFKDSLKNKKKAMGFEFSLKILTNGCWPEFSSQSQCMIPPEIKYFIENFENHYSARHNTSRNVSWVFSEGIAEISILLGKKKYMAIVTTHSLFALIALNNNNNKMTFAKLAQASLLTKEDLTLALLPLLKPNPIIITNKNQKNQMSFADSEEISLNDDFESSAKKISCIARPQIKKKQATKEDKEKEELEINRSTHIDSAIVRVMKARKHLKFNQIVDDVYKLINLFKPQPTQIKKRIESLIERLYLARDENDTTLFIYIP